MNSLPGSHEQKSRISFTEAIAAFQRSLQARNASQGTIRAYLEDVGQFIVWFQDQSVLAAVDQVERRDIEAFLAYLGKKGITGTSRRRKLSALRRFFGCLEMDGCIGRDPTKGVARPKAEERTPQILFGHEYKALLYEARGHVRDQAILQVFLQTGIRVGELCALTIDDVDLKARELTVRQGKGMKDRTIPLTQEASQAVARYLAARGATSTDRVFLTKYGTPFDTRSANYMLQRYDAYIKL